MVNEVEVETVNAEPGKEYVFTVDNEINDVNLSQDGCVQREDKSDDRQQSLCQRVPSGLGTPSWNSVMVRLVSEVPTEKRSKNTESDRSGW